PGDQDDRGATSRSLVEKLEKTLHASIAPHERPTMATGGNRDGRRRRCLRGRSSFGGALGKRLRGTSDFGDESIPSRTNGLQYPRALAIQIHRPAKNRQRLRENVRMNGSPLPNFANQLGVRDDSIAMPQEVEQDIEGPRRQRHRHTPAPKLEKLVVDL